MSQEGVVNIGDQSVKGFEKTPVRRIKLTQGKSVRVTFKSDEVVSRLRHYLKGVGYRRCLSYTGFCPGCIAAEKDGKFWKGKELKRASEVFNANVFVYDTDDSLENVSQKIGDVFLFTFGAEKFSQLREIKQMYGSLVGLDIKATCIDENFQKMTLIAYPKEKAFINDDTIAKVVGEKFEKDSYPLNKLAAKEVSPAQMVKDFGLNPAIMELPEAKQFLDIASQQGQGEQPQQQEQKQFFKPGQVKPEAQIPQDEGVGSQPAPAQKSTGHAPEPPTYDANSVLDEL